MTPAWLSVLASILGLLRQLVRFMSERKLSKKIKLETQNQFKANSHDMLIKALKARRDVRASHSAKHSRDIAPDKLQDD